MNIRSLSLCALLSLPVSFTVAMDSPERVAQPQIPDMKQILTTLTDAIKNGNEDIIGQCSNFLGFHNAAADSLFPLMQQIIDGKTKLDAKNRSWALAGFAFIFSGTKYYEKVCDAIAALRMEADRQGYQPVEPFGPAQPAKRVRESIDQRINNAIESSDLEALFQLLDQCETREQRERINTILSTL